jgi:hypothetical protein
MMPFVIGGYVLQIKYFGGIDPNVITSCCGVLFSEGGTGVGSSLASLPVRQTEVVFYSLFLAVFAVGVAATKTGRKVFKILLAFLSASFFFASVAAIVSFVSLYFYQNPTHHCPFDILQEGYYYAGYPLYVSLFAGSFFGTMTGVIQPLGRIKTLSAIIPAVQRKWTFIALAAFTLFVLITLIPIVFTPFTLEGY